MARLYAGCDSMKLIVLTGLIFASGLASAQVTLSSFPPNPNAMPGGGWQWTSGSTFANPTSPRQWTNGVYGGVKGIMATDAVVIAGRAGVLPVAVASSVSLSSGMAAAARCLATLNPVCAVAAAAVAVAYDRYRVKPVQSGSGLTVDPGAAPVDTAGFTCNLGGMQGKGGSPFSACQTAADKQTTFSNTVYRYSGYVTSCDLVGKTCTWTAVTSYPTLNLPDSVSPGQSASWYPDTFSQCPASIDALNPANTIPAGGPVGLDGKCATARYNHAPITPEAAATLAGKDPSPDMATWQKATSDAIDKGGQSASPAGITSSGPASQQGAPTTTTTTAPTGGTTTTTTTPTYNYNYSGDKIIQSTTTSTTTNTCTGTASCSQTTTTTDAPPVNAGEVADDCKVSPDRAGCAKLATPPEAETIPKIEVPVTYTPTVFQSAGGCPSNITFQAYGTRTLEVSGLCDLMTTLYPIFMALGAAAAALIFMQGLRI